MKLTRALGWTALTIAGLALTLLVAGELSGYLRWQPGSGSLALFAPINLVTCLSEETFFRGFFQRQWHLALKGPGTVTAGIVLSGVLFGFAHLAGGLLYVALASIAGIGYAFIFHATRRLECSILTHWTVNALHFLLLSYPAVAAVLR